MDSAPASNAYSEDAHHRGALGNASMQPHDLRFCKCAVAPFNIGTSILLRERDLEHRDDRLAAFGVVDALQSIQFAVCLEHELLCFEGMLKGSAGSEFARSPAERADGAEAYGAWIEAGARCAVSQSRQRAACPLRLIGDNLERTGDDLML